MKNFKKNTLGLTLLIVGFIIATLGIAYAVMVVYDDITGTNNHSLVLGDIYMYYNETNQLTLENATPSVGPDETKYFEFTVSGKNTYTKQDIYYEIVLTHGDNHATRTERIKDSLLKFRLVEIKDNQETVVIDNESYNSLNNQRIWVNTINKNTQSDIEVTYRLYMWIDYDTVIGNTTDADYDMDTWNNQVYGSIKVNVKGDFQEKTSSKVLKDNLMLSLNNPTDTSCKTKVEEDGIIYISGTKDCINFNYVWYSGKLWRITAIYPDGTMKMITDGMITSIAYGADNKFYTDENTTSYMYQWLNQEFLPTLYNYENIIVEDATWNASPGNRTISSKLPVSGQEEVLVNASVGLLNSYEYYKSYQNTSYSNGYLNIGYFWRLLNPDSASSSLYVWYVDDGGRGSYGGPSYAYGGRPSIYLKSGVQLIGGTGTESNPYRIKGDKEQTEANVTLINTRQSGEYVNFDGSLYRIVGIENETTKLIKDDYVKDENSTILTKAVASSTIFGKDTNTGSDNYWDYYLNNTWKPAITDDYENMLVEGTYYTKYFTGGNYKNTACATVSNATSIKDCDKTGVSTWSGYVGLPRYGEMFASQTRDYTSNNVKFMWLITPYSSLFIWNVTSGGNGSNYSPSDTFGGRPTINLKSAILIKSGSGTKQDPFVVGLPN